VITWFEVEQLVRRLYREREYDNQRLSIRGSYPSARTLSQLKGILIHASYVHGGKLSQRPGYGDTVPEAAMEEFASIAQPDLLTVDSNFPRTVLRVTGIPDAPADEICCLVDPWCYVSHLSAMQLWGLSNRNSVELQITRPAKNLWNERAKKELKEELGDDYDNLLLGLISASARERVTFPKIVRRRRIHTFEPNYFGRSVETLDSATRVATVGQTFRDMLHEPGLCGGMSHVLDVWDQHAETHLDEIIETLSDPASKTTKIALVRAGYILTERLALQDNRIDAWALAAERGGSRRLDPERPFHPSFSERWMLSLNV